MLAVLASIDFDNQARVMTREVYDVRPQSDLSPEMGSGNREAMPQMPP
jgi:hypothetical protein